MLTIELSNTIAADLHDEMRKLITEGITATCPDGNIEVHVRGVRHRTVYDIKDGRRVVRTQGGYRARATAKAFADAHGYKVKRRAVVVHHFSGRSYRSIPSIANVHTNADWLVTLKVTADPRLLTVYPYTSKYPGLVTAPTFVYASWQEELVHLAAHEGRHIEQSRTNVPHSEIDAELCAGHALDVWRERRDAFVMVADPRLTGVTCEDTNPKENTHGC